MRLILSEPSRAKRYGCARSARRPSGLTRWLGQLATVTVFCLGLARPSWALNEEEILSAVRAAFDAYEQLPCFGLTFNYKGKPPGLPTEQKDAIVIWFSGTDIPWTAGELPFDGNVFTGNVEGILTRASLGINSTVHAWRTDGDPNAYDIQTVVMRQLSNLLGFCVTEIANGCRSTPSPGEKVSALPALHALGAKALYFDGSASGCSEEKPAEPPDCDEIQPPAAADAGPGADGGTGDAQVPQAQLCLFRTPKTSPAFHWPGPTVDYYVALPADGKLPGGTGGGPGGDAGGGGGRDAGFGGSDGGVTGCTDNSQCGEGEICGSQGICIPRSGGDDGCCRFHQTPDEQLRYGLLTVLGLMLLVARERRRVRQGQRGARAR